jgi:hypothetical protein
LVLAPAAVRVVVVVVVVVVGVVVVVVVVVGSTRAFLPRACLATRAGE